MRLLEKSDNIFINLIINNNMCIIMNRVGRPEKNTGYGELKVVSVNLPKDLIQYIEEIAEELNVSRSEVVFNIIATSDREQVKDFNLKLNELINTIKHLKDTNKETMKQIDKFAKTITLRGGLYKPIQKDSKIANFVIKNKELIKSKNLDKNEILRIILNDYEEECLKEGLEINRSKVRILLEKEILEQIEIIKKQIEEKLKLENEEKERIRKEQEIKEKQEAEKKRIEHEIFKANRIERLKKDPDMRERFIRNGIIGEIE